MKRYEKPVMQVREIRVKENLAKMTATSAVEWVERTAGVVVSSVWTLSSVTPS